MPHLSSRRRLFGGFAVTCALLALAVPTAATPPEQREGAVEHVVAISIDGLHPDAITAANAPTISRMLAEGAGTLNARTEYEQTVTLPNHTSMVTSRRITKTKGGHGVTWDDDRLRPATVQAAAGEPVGSAFTVTAAAGGSTALFVSKPKLSLYKRSWPLAVDRSTIIVDNAALVSAVRTDLVTAEREFTFVHLSGPDLAGHRSGWMTPAYLRAVRAADALVGQILTTISGDPDLSPSTVVLLTADHGGLGHGHAAKLKYADYRIPFIAWGAGVAQGSDLYELNTASYADPGRERPGYAKPLQPIRNGDLGNLVTDLLGLPAIGGSQLNADQSLRVLDISAP